MANNYKNFCHLALAVIETEANAILELSKRINEDFSKACQLLFDCKGRIIVTGIGKSGHIANKIASTFASTGSPAFYVHPGEACHGDMGMLTKQDVVLAVSNSGTTPELITLLPAIKRLGIPLLSLVGKVNSPLAQASDIAIDVSVSKEACPLGLAPTASTTAALVMGDALAIALLEVRGFTPEDFARSHPGGQLGRKLLLHVEDLMITGAHVPRVRPQTLLRDALLEMTAKKLGFTAITDENQKLLGIFTDGDLRRALDHHMHINEVTIGHLMTTSCKTIHANRLAAEALKIMNDHKITALMIVDENHCLIGVIHMHTLLQHGLT